MARLKSVDELNRLCEAAQRTLKVRADTGTTIIVGIGTCGIAAGARETLQAVRDELHRRNIEAHIKTVGCIGQCAKEPLVDIEQAGQPRVTYANVQPNMVPRIIEVHLVEGGVVREWALGRLENA